VRFRVFLLKFRLEGLEVRQRLRIPRLAGLFRHRNVAQARAALEQVVQRGVELQVGVVIEQDLLERAQLAHKLRHAAEAAVAEMKLAQRIHPLQLFGESHVVGRDT
jgi:type II secretory pathway component PulF